MRKTLKYLMILLLIIPVISSCRVRRANIPLASIDARVNFSMEDLEYIGEVTGSSTQSYLLGVLPIGGRRFTSGVAYTGTPGFLNVPSGNRGFRNAMYDAIQMHPDADFIMPVAYTVERDVMFLGRKERIMVRGKAFKIRTNQ